jgi:N-acetylmuramoyl-L-alanine amidase
MKLKYVRFFKSILTLFVFAPYFIYAQNSSNKKIVLIDPGHGGDDFGAVASGLSEEFVVFDVSLKLQKELEHLNIKSELTRSKKQTISLPERVQHAIVRQPDLFVSIHANIHENPNVRGAEFYIEPSNALLGHTDFLTFLSTDLDLKALSPTEHPRFYYPNVKKLGIRSPANIIILDMLRMKTRRQSLDLAESLKKFWVRKSEIREGQFYVVRQLPIPSALIELGYLSNPDDFRVLNSNEKRQELAKNLALGLKQYFENTKLKIN